MELTGNLILIIIFILMIFKGNLFEQFHEKVSEDNKGLKLGPPYNDYPNAYFDYINPHDFIKYHEYKGYPTEFYHHPYGVYYPYQQLV